MIFLIDKYFIICALVSQLIIGFLLNLDREIEGTGQEKGVPDG